MRKILEWLEYRELHGPANGFQCDLIVTPGDVKNLQHTNTLSGHDGCVNTLTWNKSGRLLASGSDDQHIIIWEESGLMKHKFPTAHTNNIFSVQFLPRSQDRLVVSCAGDCVVLLHDYEYSSRHSNEPSAAHKWECEGRAKRLAVSHDDPFLFWSASEDAVVRQYDVRTYVAIELIREASSRIQFKSLALNENRPEMIAVALNEPMVPVYDRRNLKEPVIKLCTAYHPLSKSDRRHSVRTTVTHVAFNNRGDELIVNIGGDAVYIYNVLVGEQHNPDLLQRIEDFLSHVELNQPSTSGEENPSDPDEPEKQPLHAENFREERDRAKGFFSDKRHNEAIDIYSECIYNYEQIMRKRKSQFNRLEAAEMSMLLSNRAICLLQRAWEGDVMESVRDNVRALEVDPTNKKAHYRLAKCLVALKQYTLAKKIYETYLARYPKDDSLLDSVKKSIQKGKETKNEWTHDLAKEFRDYQEHFTGHSNMNTDIKEANWYGGRDQYIVGGSDCGSLFVWERATGKIIGLWKADEHILNCVQPHPTKCLIATSGIDSVVRFWEPARFLTKVPPEVGEPNERDRCEEIYETMYGNQRRTQRMQDIIQNSEVFQMVLDQIGIRMGPARGGGDEEGDGGDEQDNGGGNEDGEDGQGREGVQTIQCRTS